MFVTNLPARVVKTEFAEVASSGTLAVGYEGLGTKMKVHGGGLILTSAEQPDKTTGYRMSDGEVIEFSGCVDVYNPNGDALVTVSLIITDPV